MKWVMVVKLLKRNKWGILYKNPFKWDLQVSENLNIIIIMVVLVGLQTSNFL